jgi:hypothetical protein
MTGTRVAVTAGSTVDGVAATDSRVRKATIVLGSRGGVTGGVTVQLDNIPPYLQSSGQTHVTVEQIPEVAGYVSDLAVVSDQGMTVANNSLTLTVKWSSAHDAYAITVIP